MDTLQDSLEFLTETELARRWKVSVRMIQKHRLQGEGVPFHRLGGVIRYRLSDVLKYEAARQYRSTSEYGPLP